MKAQAHTWKKEHKLIIIIKSLGYISYDLCRLFFLLTSPCLLTSLLWLLNRQQSAPTPQLKKTKQKKQGRLATEAVCHHSLNITHINRRQTHSWACTSVVITVSYRTVSIHRTDWNVICTTAAAANAQREQARVRLQLRLWCVNPAQLTHAHV